MSNDFSSSTNRFIAKALLCLAAVVIMANLWNGVNKAIFLGQASYADGAVIEARGNKPLVAFETQTGRSVTFTASFLSKSRRFQVGESMTVAYLESAPEAALVDEFVYVWGLNAFLCLVTLILFVLGYFTRKGAIVWGPR